MLSLLSANDKGIEEGQILKNEKIKRKLCLTKALRKAAKYCLKNDDALKTATEKEGKLFRRLENSAMDSAIGGNH